MAARARADVQQALATLGPLKGNIDDYATEFEANKVAAQEITRGLNRLVIGLGAGSSEKAMLRDFPDVRMHAVEIDPVVVDVAQRYFEVPEDEVESAPA